MNIRQVIKGLGMISTLAAAAGLGQTAAAVDCEGFPDDTRGVNTPVTAQGEDDTSCEGVISFHSVDTNPKTALAFLSENPTTTIIRVSTEATSDGIPIAGCKDEDTVADGIDDPTECDTPLPITGMIIRMEQF